MIGAIASIAREELRKNFFRLGMDALWLPVGIITLVLSRVRKRFRDGSYLIRLLLGMR
jgi:hypothetical protein